MSLKCMNGACMIKYWHTLKIDFQNFNMAFARVIVHSTVYQLWMKNGRNLYTSIYLIGSKEWSMQHMESIFYAVPQASILGPLLFNIPPSDLFYFLKNTDNACYVDKSTLYLVKKNKETVINAIKKSFPVFFKANKSRYIALIVVSGSID